MPELLRGNEGRDRECVCACEKLPEMLEGVSDAELSQVLPADMLCRDQVQEADEAGKP